MKDRVPELDVLRFAAALAVMLYHYMGWADFETPFGFGWLGVQLFFMISGFVILWSALGKSPAEFVISRFSRLYPTYWICIGIMLAAMAMGGRQINWPQVATNLTMLHQAAGIESLDAVYWTLYVELKFYVMIFALLLLRQQRWMERWLALWLVAAVVSMAVPIVGKLTLGYHAAFFISGATLYFIRSKGLTLRREVMLAVSAALGIFSAQQISGHYGSANPIAVALIVLAVHAIFLLVALRKIRLPTLPVWYWIGCMTYPLYLIHAGTGKLVWEVLPASDVVRVGAVSIFSLSMAAVLAYFIERRACGKLNSVLMVIYRRSQKMNMLDRLKQWYADQFGDIPHRSPPEPAPPVLQRK